MANNFEEAKKEFLDMQPLIAEKADELKAIKKIHNVHKTTIYNYMRENDIEELEVGEQVFSIKTKQTLAIKQSDIEELIEAARLAPFYQEKESYGVKKRKVSRRS